MLTTVSTELTSCVVGYRKMGFSVKRESQHVLVAFVMNISTDHPLTATTDLKGNEK